MSMHITYKYKFVTMKQKGRGKEVIGARFYELFKIKVLLFRTRLL
jgi:hypothetical protein